ncbi:hypothetical protein [uncultured Maribacter sp.]|uniref:hypothetical protein n=1 Tax=uncultured Maribacter sp. TaxID=431308 RepID=UPI002639C3B7|nr:hypothetical protein [uncultured Maribacter sp.]
MVHNPKIRNAFYQNLGKLFYAIAMADKQVNSHEVQKLKEDVRKYWVPLDNTEDAYGTDAAFQIEIVFDWLHLEEKESEYYYKEFLDFYKEHPTFFTPDINKIIWKTADDIASSFSGKNKSELILLAKLKQLLT